MDAAKMSSAEASVILGAAVIDDVMGLFVLAFLAASTTSSQGEGFGIAAMASSWFKRTVPAASGHQLLVDMASISVCVVIFFTAAYLAAKRWLDHLSGWNRRPSTPSLPPASSGVRRST